MGDPRYPGFSLAFPVILSQVIDAQENDSPSTRETLNFGGSVSLIQVRSSHVSVGLAVGAGVFTQFDSFSDALDNFAWEGTGFLTIDAAIGDKLSFRTGFHHLSSHIGDEYLARYNVLNLPLSGADQISIGDGYGIDYVRDSLLFALSCRLDDGMRVYLESRYSMNMLAYPW
jgi:hypothetical protein